MADPIFKFQMRYVDRSTDPYYHTRWDRATSATILAGARDEAGDKLVAMLGEPPSGRRWVWSIDRIDEVQINDYLLPCPHCDGTGGELLGRDDDGEEE